MSRSSLTLELRFAMLEGRKECVPGYEDSTGGHVIFKCSAKTKVCPPGSWTFDSLEESYDREKYVQLCVEELKQDLAFDALNGDRMLRALIGNVFDQAKSHCDEHHEDVRKKFGVKRE